MTENPPVCYGYSVALTTLEDVMPSLQRLESQIASLPEPQLRQFRTWFNEFDARNWDLSLETDINGGKLDSLAAEALAQYSAGQCKPL